MHEQGLFDVGRAAATTNRLDEALGGAGTRASVPGAHSRFPGHALTPTGVMAIRCKQFHLPDL